MKLLKSPFVIPGTSTRFVVFRPGALGDTLVAAPTLWALAKRYPEVRIEYISEHHEKSGVVAAGEVLALIPQVAKSHLYTAGSSWFARLRKVREVLAPSENDVLLYLSYEQSSSWRILRDWTFFYLAGFRRFVGFGAAIRSRFMRSQDESEYRRLFRFANSSNLDLTLETAGRLSRDEEWGARFWRSNGLEGRRVVAVCPGSKMQSKRWPPERYADVISRLSMRFPEMRFVILGAGGDRKVLEQVRSQAKGHIIDALDLSLPRACAILSLSDAYLGNDTGPMHMAALLGIPCVALFSSRDRPGKWSPWGSGHRILRTDIRCAGCMLENCFVDPPECLSGISVDSVERALVGLLDENNVPNGRGSLR